MVICAKMTGTFYCKNIFTIFEMLIILSMDALHILFILIILALLLAYFIGKKRDDKEATDTSLLLARKEQEVTSLQAEKASLQAALRADIEELKSELNQERERYMDSERRLEKIQSYFTAQSQKVADQKAELSELKSQMTKEFELIANKILQDKSDRFSESNHKSLFQILDQIVRATCRD